LAWEIECLIGFEGAGRLRLGELDDGGRDVSSTHPCDLKVEEGWFPQGRMDYKLSRYSCQISIAETEQMRGHKRGRVRTR
jgi:hypothetical protein